MGISCKTCKHDNKEWWEEPCDSCTVGGDTNHYEPIDDIDGEEGSDKE